MPHSTTPTPRGPTGGDAAVSRRYSPLEVASPGEPAYGREFWLLYLANGLTMTALTMLVRYADFVTFLGGGEAQLGLIVGVGMIGSLAMRVAQGIGIDRYGSRRIWLASLGLLVLSLLAHLCITSASGPGVYLVRILMQTSIAGIFGASITYISLRVPPERMAEIVGTIGTSGFLGMLAGPFLSDWICGEVPLGRGQLDRLFIISASFGVLAAAVVALATRQQPSRSAKRRPLVWAVVWRYQPGLILLVAVAVGSRPESAGHFSPHRWPWSGGSRRSARFSPPTR